MGHIRAVVVVVLDGTDVVTTTLLEVVGFMVVVD